MPAHPTCMGTVMGFKALSGPLEERFGPPRDGEDEVDGVGTFDLQNLAFPCGLTVELARTREDFYGPIERATRESGYRAYCSDDDRAHVAFHLGIPPASLWTQPLRGNSEQPSAPLRFTVMRLDDNGNEAEVTRTTNRCEADAIAATYTSRAHKQTYWVL